MRDGTGLLSKDAQESSSAGIRYSAKVHGTMSRHCPSRGFIMSSVRAEIRNRLPNEELNLTALASEAASSLRSLAALLLVRRSLAPARSAGLEAHAA